ncbi:ATP-dependent helicase HrpB [Marinobacter salicampi]|uniref:ATP-dependent helicase HrpB n=1 Tax=Marinobacter salicampi TaxID=435907 RepID=UPI00140DD691|nr:ATP-dependent helicase HrpB [Marinobacter salicampi]
MDRPDLPIDALLPDLLAALECCSTVLLQAAPGAGKTTRVPPALLTAPWRQERKILMLEPRRLAARTAARFMARQLGEEPGQTIGYRTRLDSRISAQTVVEVVTEGILTRLIQEDPALENYAAVLFDEFHERSLQADLGLALVRESQQALREDLRVVVMSATLDTAPLAQVLNGAPVLSSTGRAYPVAVHYRPPSPRERLSDQVARIVIEALTTETGSLLVFLPGVKEIRWVVQALANRLPANVHLAPLYGNLGADEQDRAIAPTPAGERKIVLATAIAETSLTIEGVRVVIDSGLQRRAVFDANSGMTRLVTGRLSRAAAEQRKGRAGRTQSGVCYRLWGESEHFGLAEHAAPEILEADLAPLALELAQWGARSPDDLAWLDPPPGAHWQQAVDLLQWLDMLDDTGAITGHGQAAQALPCHPRLAHMVLQGRKLGWPVLAANLAALLEERDLLGARAGADISLRLQILRGDINDAAVDPGRLRMVRENARRLVRPGSCDRQPGFSATDAGRLLAQAFPDRIARRRSGQGARFVLSNGRGAYLQEEDPLAQQQWLTAADLDGQAREARIYLAAALDQSTLTEDLAHHIRDVTESVWDDRRGRVVVRRQQRLGELVLSQAELPDPPPEQMQQGLLNAIRTRGMGSLPWTEASRQWCARVTLLRQYEPEGWPDVSDKGLMAGIDDWFGPFLAGMTTWSQVQRMDLMTVLQSMLSHDQQQALARHAPTDMVIPTGQSVRLDYTSESGPVLAAKLQALFGWVETPRLVHGRHPVVLHLLSPAGRPLAVTSDLQNFWRNVYPQVRKDTRGRYPKHPWPEDPFSAQARAGTKKQGY